MAAKPTHVIVGASLAGAKAAEALREEGFDGRIVLIGAEYEPPYERPALSKDFIRAESEREKLLVHDSDFYSQHHIELRTSTTVREIDPEATEVVLAGGERLGYDRLLLTTGAAPRRLAVPGSDLEGVLYLRELGDAERIREGIARGGRLVVIGAGWIGAEVAASAREKGLEVTIVEQGAVPLERVLGPRIGEVYAYIHRDHGTQLVTGAGLEAFEGAGRVERVRLTDGRTLDCDFVVVGIGVLPRTELAERAGLEVTRGVVVDERLETSVPGVFAADVANHRHPVFGALHLEHCANALNQGPAAARAMLGRGGAYDRVPYFYSDQYDVGMEYSGFAGGEDEVVFRGDPAAREFVAFWLRDGRVAAGMNVNVWGVTGPSRRSFGPRSRSTEVSWPTRALRSGTSERSVKPPPRRARARGSCSPKGSSSRSASSRRGSRRASRPRYRRSRAGRRRSSRSAARRPASTATTKARCMRSRPSARTWAASSTGTGPSAPGTARATGRASTQTAACSGAPPRRT